MEKREILKRLDHTLLKQDATWEQIKKICDEGVEYGVASVCIPPRFYLKTDASFIPSFPTVNVTVPFISVLSTVVPASLSSVSSLGCPYGLFSPQLITEYSGDTAETNSSEDELFEP